MFLGRQHEGPHVQHRQRVPRGPLQGIQERHPQAGRLSQPRAV